MEIAADSCFCWRKNTIHQLKSRWLYGKNEQAFCENKVWPGLMDSWLEEWAATWDGHSQWLWGRVVSSSIWTSILLLACKSLYTESCLDIAALVPVLSDTLGQVKKAWHELDLYNGWSDSRKPNILTPSLEFHAEFSFSEHEHRVWESLISASCKTETMMVLPSGVPGIHTKWVEEWMPFQRDVSVI